MAETGRPTKYNPDFHPKLVKSLARLGLTDEEIAEEMEISTATLYNWSNQHEAFLEAKRAGKEHPDDLVEKSLFEMATGYSYETEKALVVSDGKDIGSHVENVTVQETIPPNTTAMIFWLKNRRPEKWRDRQEIDFKGEMKTTSVSLDDLESHINSSTPREE